MTDAGPLAPQLGQFAAASTFDRLPDEVRASVKMRVLDILGICLAASTMDTSRAARAFAADQGAAPQASAVGIGGKVPAAIAAFVNGVLAHSLDYDDTHLPSVLHPSASVVPAALATAQACGASGAATIAAIASGLEVCVRLGMAGYDERTGSSTFFDHGQHATSICGALGGAVAAGVLLGLDAERITHALGVAASMGSGIIEANRTGGTVKRLHCGWAAHAGVSAAQLAAHGFTGPPTVLEGRFGFYQAWLHGHFDPDAITSGLGKEWTVPDIVFKPYPANHFTHTAIDAAMALRSRIGDLGDIESIELGVAAPIVHTIGEPIEVKRTPETGYMAQFSGPYAVVAGLLGGGGLGLGIDDFSDELARDPSRRALMSKVDVVADERCTALFPHQFPSVLRVRLVDGSELVEEAMANRGGPGHPLSFEELSTKFEDNASRVLPPDAVAAVERDVAGLDNLAGIDGVFSHLVLPPGSEPT
ncbi:MAG: MmgE/PrpD family protein [Acidimicrobiales bacterium]